MAVNDDTYTYLARLGYEGAFNDKLYKHLTAEGFLQQSLTDKLAAAGGYKSYVLGSLLSDSIVGSLFYANEQGVWYDPNDLTTLFQDSAGTTPVTAAGQPVGLMLDKSKGLVLGSELALNGDFSVGKAGWSGAAGTVEAGEMHVVRPDSAGVSVQQSIAVIAGRWYSVSGVARRGISGAGSARVEVVSNSVTTRVCEQSGTSGAQFSGVVYAGAATMAVNLIVGNVAGDAFFDNISVREIPGNHAFQSTAASRPVLRLNATTGAYYLETDGVDDWMQTNSINFTGTDKVSVFAVVRKLSDAARGMLIELGSSSTGAFRAEAPNLTASGNYLFTSGGSIAGAGIAAVNGYSAPHTAVFTGTGDISADLARLRINGAQVASSSADQGTGNYGNYPLYLFRRGGTTLPFIGHFYGLIIVGRLASTTEISNVESILANKTGVTLA